MTEFMRTWVKVYTSITSDRNFKRLTSRARLTFMVSIPEAGRCDRGGLLAERTGPITTSDFCEMTGYNVAEQKMALKELVRTEFMTTTADGYFLNNFNEKYNPDPTNAERQKRFRNARRNGARNGDSNASGNGVEEDIEIEGRGKSNAGVTPPPDFGDLEPDIVLFIDNVRSENKSGTLKLTRELSLRRELFAEMADHDRAAFAAGLREANAKGKPHVNYVRQCARSAAENLGVRPAPKRRSPTPADLLNQPGFER